MIPVPVKQLPNATYPLNVEDTDIPFIEDESRQTNSKYLQLYFYMIVLIKWCL